VVVGVEITTRSWTEHVAMLSQDFHHWVQYSDHWTNTDDSDPWTNRWLRFFLGGREGGV